MTTKEKVLVAMSGGVDSSVTAGLLSQAGYDVVGVTLRLLPGEARGFGCCGAPEDMLLAKRSAERVGIPHYVLDYAPDFKTHVIDYFIDAYLDGQTPNPCLACNRHIKFDKLKHFADSVGATAMATGHYARLVPGEFEGKQVVRLFESVDLTKDQSYVLYTLGQDLLQSTMFPVGDKPKTEIRELAKTMGLPNHDKKDSQEICFVPGNDYRQFIESSVSTEKKATAPALKPGLIRNHRGEEIGRHQGTAFYTVGQRHGLGLQTNKRFYVTKIDAKANTLIVGDDSETGQTELEAHDLSWVLGAPPASTFEALVKIRYKHDPAPATVTVSGDSFQVHFDTPQKAITPGQAAVLYRYDENLKAREVLGGGTIVEGRHEQ